MAAVSLYALLISSVGSITSCLSGSTQEGGKGSGVKRNSPVAFKAETAVRERVMGAEQKS